MLQPDQMLGDRYQLCRRLGSGEPALRGRQTWQALDLQGDPAESVVIKLLAFSPDLDWDQIKLFEREVELLRSLGHPALPTYRDSFSLPGQPLWMGLVQSYIPGESLAEQLRAAVSCGRSPWDEASLRQLAAQLLSILDQLHRLHPPLLHRDIKPSNIIVDPDQRVHLIDWGAAQSRSPQRMPGGSFTVVGTYGYAPLEQFGGRAVAASDLHALGATLIHLLTGICPADLPQENLHLQFEAPAERPVSSGFRRWLQTLTEPDYQRRYPTAAAALAALQALPQPAALATTPSTHRHLSIPLHSAAPPPGSGLRLTRSPDLLLVETPGAEAGSPLAVLGVLTCLAGLLSSSWLLAPGIPLTAVGLWLASPQVLRFERRGQQVYACLGKRLGGYIVQSDRAQVRPLSSEAVRQVCHSVSPPAPVPQSQGFSRSWGGRLLRRLPRLRHQHYRTLTIQTVQGETPIPTTLSWQEGDWLVSQIHQWLG